MTEQHALARLIESVKEANSWNNTDLERAASRRGHSVSRSNISRILKEPVKTVVPSQVRMLADATGLPLELVTLAAVRATGLSVDVDSTDLVTAVRRDLELPEEAKHAILSIITSYKKRRRQANVTDLDSRRSNELTPRPSTSAASHGELEPGDVGDDV